MTMVFSSKARVMNRQKNRNNSMIERFLTNWGKNQTNYLPIRLLSQSQTVVKTETKTKVMPDYFSTSAHKQRKERQQNREGGGLKRLRTECPANSRLDQWKYLVIKSPEGIFPQGENPT